VTFSIVRGRMFKATFVDRPNRFLVRCRAGRRGVIEAFLPNPGRLWELLLPGATLTVEEARDTATRRTRYTVLAVERDGRPIVLHTHLTNAVAQHLIERRRIPGLEHAEIVWAEVPVGRSRFDFLLREHGRDLLLEVKSVTLFGNRVAMFPDAVTERGRRHLLELARLARAGTPTAVLFVIHTLDARWFMPDYHTDPAFSRTLLDVRPHVRITPAAIRWTPDLELGRTVRVLDVPWVHLDREVADRGAYLLVLRLARRRRIDVGRLGALQFDAGYYVYAGSAMRGLTARIARHMRLRKRRRWHIDHLCAAADGVVALPIRSSRREECAIAAACAAVLAPGPAGFGCSDCDCPTHLFHAPDNPLHASAFHDLLQRFRMRPPDA